jgi:hypothetical protein
LLYCDLLRMTMLLSAGSATALAGIAVVAANREADTTTLIVAAAWWSIALLAGFILGRPRRSAEAVRTALSRARSLPTLPTDNPGRVALARLWPLGAFALVAGALGFVFPGVATVGAGYGLGAALAWRGREGAVHAIEERDGVRFYVEPGSAFEAVRLVRTPGLRRGRDPAGSPPLPPSAAS